MLADFDPQGSSLAWLRVRPDGRPAIRGIATWQESLRVPQDTDYVIMDAPSGGHGKALPALIRHAQTAIIPVLPSPMDIRAATTYIKELRQVGELARPTIHESAGVGEFFAGLFQGGTRSATRLAVVANRVKENTLAYDVLYEFLDRLKIPFLTTLRDTQNYIHAAERGLGLFELAPSQVAYDLDLWEPMIRWLNSKRSLPR